MTALITSSDALKKTQSVLFFLSLFYVLPLLGKPSLLLDPQVIFLAVICSILFATQPRLSISESQTKKGTDRNTVWLILIVSAIGQITSLIEWAYFSPSTAGTDVALPIHTTYDLTNLPISLDFFKFKLPLKTIGGAILLITGTLFRLYAINVLGKYFTATVQIKEQHRIVTNGPYKLLRHPSYTGAYLAMLGCAIFLHSTAGIFIFGIGMLFIYHLRIKTEEQTLLQNFGEKYLSYSKRTWKMFPFVW